MDDIAARIATKDLMLAEIEKAMLACFTEGTGAMIQSLDGAFMHLPNTDLFAWPAPVQVEIPPLVPVRAKAPGRANRLTMALRAAYP